MARSTGATLPADSGFEERLMNMVIREKTSIHQGKLLANQLGQVRVQFESSLLGMQKNPH